MVLSGLIFGLAVLTKMTAIFLIPAVLFIAFQQRWQHQGRFAFLGWIMPMLMVVSLYFLYALFKGELLPESTSPIVMFLPEWIRDRFFAGEGQVSLVETLRWQGTRPGGSIFEPDSLIRVRIRYDWLPIDPILFVGGILATVVNFFRGLRDRLAMSAALLGLLPLIYIFRGGVVFDFYIIFNIPFLALNIAVLLTSFEKILPSKSAAVIGTYLLSVSLLLFYVVSGRTSPLYDYKPDQPAREAISWIKSNIHPQSMMIIGDDMWTDLREPGLGGPAFSNAHSHWKVSSDPEIRDGIFNNNWENVDYLVLHQETVATYEMEGNDLALEALANATLMQRWGDDLSFVEIWKVNNGSVGEKDLLHASHLYMKRHFSRNGAFYNSNGTVTSENQAYAMLRSVWLDDRTGFYNAWQWTERNLLKDNGLIAWLWKDGEIVDSNSAADADVDTALALLFAGRTWNDPRLIEAGTRIVKAIWEHEVVLINDQPYLTAGEWAAQEPIYVLNPSYFSPYAFRVFQEVDGDNRWLDLVDTSYRVIFQASEDSLSKDRSAGLPPDWVGIDPATGDLVPVDLGDDRDTTIYGYEASRTYWRIALDLRYIEDGRARSFFDLAGFIHDEIQRKGYVSAVYTKDGEILEEAPSMVGLAGALAAMLTMDPQAGNSLYIQHVKIAVTRYSDSSVSWGNPSDLYDQEWGWFATALYADSLPNLWWDLPGDRLEDQNG